MKIGFTGTRRGMTLAQKAAFGDTMKLVSRGTDEFHHGDCEGADDEAAALCHASGMRDIICHPPVDESHRAFNRLHSSTLPAKTHFARNRDIVDAAHVLIAAPCETAEQDFGGTWYTINYARKRGKMVYVIWPNGCVTTTNTMEPRGVKLLSPTSGSEI